MGDKGSNFIGDSVTEEAMRDCDNFKYFGTFPQRCTKCIVITRLSLFLLSVLQWYGRYVMFIMSDFLLCNLLFR